MFKISWYVSRGRAGWGGAVEGEATAVAVGGEGVRAKGRGKREDVGEGLYDV